MATVASVAALVFVKTDLRVPASGALQPSLRQKIFAPTDGIVRSVLVDHADVVTTDQALLTMENPELDRQIDELLGQIQTTDQRLSDAKAIRLGGRSSSPEALANLDRLAAEVQQLEVQQRSLRQQQRLLISQRESLDVTATIAGQIVTWNPEQRLRNRPVRRGQELLEIAQVDGPWHLELLIPDRDIGPILDRQREGKAAVEFVIGTIPDKTFVGQICKIADSSQWDKDRGSVVKAIVSIDRSQLPTSPVGAEVQAKVRCLSCALGYAWFRDLLTYLQVRVWFRWT
jgi:multidrug efflux pump subunit AcrA (membrane-fusion protein)